LKWLNFYFANSGLWYTIYFSSLAGVIVLLFKRKRQSFLLLTFPAIYLLALSTRSVIYGRWTSLLTPFLSIYAAFFIDALQKFIAKRLKIFTVKSSFIPIAIVVLLVGFPALRVILFDHHISKIGTRELAYKWIGKNLSNEEMIFTTHLSSIGLHSLGQLLSKDGYTSETVGSKLSPIGYGPNLFQYGGSIVILSSSNHDIEFNNEIRSRAKLLKKFSDPLFESGFFGSKKLGLNHYSEINHLHNPTIEIYRLPETSKEEKNSFEYNYMAANMSPTSFDLMDDNSSPEKLSRFANTETIHYVGGPNLLLPSGVYQATYRLKTGNSLTNNIVARMEISPSGKNVKISSSTVKGTDFKNRNGYNEFKLLFTLEKPQRLEFRLFTYQTSEIWVDAIKVINID
jgi:hypothetical protein